MFKVSDKPEKFSLNYSNLFRGRWGERKGVHNVHNTSQPVKASTAAKVEAEAGSHSTGSATTLFKIRLRAPDRCVVRHVVMRSKQFHLGP